MSRTVTAWCTGLGIAVAAAVPLGRAGALHGQTVAAAQDRQASEGCVLLRNGNVLSGAVRATEDGYVVTRQGATVHVRGYQVEAVCGDLAAVYEHQRTAIPPGDVVRHLQLAEWCLQQGLLSEARHELEQAAGRDGTHPRLAILSRRLTVALQPEPKRAGAAVAATAGIQRVIHGDTIGDRPGTAGTTSGVPPSESSANLDGGLPEGAMEQFRRRIQPLLLNTCTTGGCHQSEGNHVFVLDRRALWGGATPTLTSKNLSAALRQVDFDAPQASPLLTAATSSHAAGLKDPPVSSDSASYALLEAWLVQVAGQEGAQREAAKIASPADAALDPPTDEDDDFTISDEELDAILSGNDDEPSIVDRRVQRGLRPIPVGRRDPFDPKEFNDRYWPRKSIAPQR